MLTSFWKGHKAGRQLKAKRLPSHQLPWRLRLEICLASWVIPPLNYFLSPQKAAQLLEPRRRYSPPREDYPIDLVCHVGRLLRLQACLHRRYCISRSYLLYRFLRRFGYPAIINFGLMGDDRQEGHCWITINGTVFFDETNPNKEFATQVAALGNVVYWI